MRRQVKWVQLFTECVGNWNLFQWADICRAIIGMAAIVDSCAFQHENVTTHKTHVTVVGKMAALSAYVSMSMSRQFSDIADMTI